MTAPTAFSLPARLLHWTMAAMILAMLFVGAGMVATVSDKRLWLFNLHKPLGIAVLLFAVARLAVRFTHRPPALPTDLPTAQRLAAHASHWLLYALMLAMPLLGWATLSAGGYPAMLGHALRLPAILPADATLYAWLRTAHRYGAWLLFATFLAHMAAALYHGLVRRDGVLGSMLGCGAHEDGRQPSATVPLAHGLIEVVAPAGAATADERKGGDRGDSGSGTGDGPALR